MGMKIVNNQNTDSCTVGIHEMKITYIQEPDTNSSSDEWQYLEVSTDTACGDEFYLNVKTDRWSIDDPKDLLVVLEDFKSRLNLKQ